MSRIIDLTTTLANGVGHAMFRKVMIAPHHTHEIHRRSNADLHMALHTATHIDAPYHFVPEGLTIDAIGLDQLIGEGVLFQVENLAKARYRFTISDLEAALETEGAELYGKMAVVVTGWSNRTFADEPRYFRESPSLSPEAAGWFVEKRVKAVVLDCATDAAEPVPVPEQKCPVHRTLLEGGVLIVENCKDLTNIPHHSRFTIYAVPLKIQSESGAPARVFAVIEE